MAIETFYVPSIGANPIKLDGLRSVLEKAALAPKLSVDGDLLWIEFDGYESRFLTNSGTAPLDLITLQYYGDLVDEAPLTDKLEEILEELDYCDAEDLDDMNE